MIGRLRHDGVSIVLVEQNVQRAIALSDRTLVMSQGRMRPAVASAGLSRLGFSDLLAQGAAP